MANFKIRFKKNIHTHTHTKAPPSNSNVLQDLAKWKNRRRSISQDLIKKEEERKMMEQLMTGEPHNPARRRSIKTYREIVEDK